MRNRSFRLMWVTSVLYLFIVFAVTSPNAQRGGGIITTPTVPLELPTEVELELAPGSLKDAPLWHEIAEILEAPSAIDCSTVDDPATPTFDESNECIALTERRPSFLPPGCSYQADAAVPCDDALMPFV